MTSEEDPNKISLDLDFDIDEALESFLQEFGPFIFDDDTFCDKTCDKREPKKDTIVFWLWRQLSNLANIHLIRWINQDDGVFTITDPNGLAKEWGLYSRANPDLDKNNMARTMRHYYSDKKFYLERVDKHYTYKFTPLFFAELNSAQHGAER